MPVPNIKLNSGAEMPQVGFGLWKVDNPIAPDVVYDAIKAGYRLFDGACGKSRIASSGCFVLPVSSCLPLLQETHDEAVEGFVSLDSIK